MRRRLVVFDCDGTLVDGQANICLAMETAFAEAALPAPPRQDIRRIVGLSLVQAMAQLAPDTDAPMHAALVEHYRAAYQQQRREGAISEPMFPGIREALTQLAQDGWLLGVATGKSDRGLAACLAAHGVADLFVTLQTADRHPSKPSPVMLQAALDEAGAAPADAVIIGDTTFDMAMGQSAGVSAIGVSWGYHRPEELAAAGAALVVDHPSDLPAAITETIGARA